MNETFKSDLAKLLLRLGVGGLMLLHGIHKLRFGHHHIADMLGNAGLPEFLQYGVPVGEVLAPVLLILGVLTVPSALIVAITMLVSIFLAFGDKLLSLNQVGGWIVELNVLFLISALAIGLIGAGRFALGKGKFR